ncbi:hypothetical protein LW133_06145 [Helicobacter sp. faydin-H8]|nr:hypothetical protein [Helicobacter anatolicus]
MFGFNKILRSLFSNTFIAINIDGNICYVKVLRLKEGRIVEDFSKEFKILEGQLPFELIKFIKNYKRRYPFSYIGVMAKTYNQGVYNPQRPEILESNGVNIRECKVLKFDNWNAYIKKNEIEEIQKQLDRFGGVDYIFSPFVITYLAIKKELDSKSRLYILYEKSNIAILIANCDEVYFAGYFMIESEISQAQEEVKYANDLLENTFDIMEELEDFEDFEDFDFFNENKEEEEVEQTIQDMNQASIVAGIIQNSLNEFYSNDLYEEKFVEEIVILDNVGISNEGLKYIADTTLMDIKKEQFDLMQELLAIIQVEFGL